MAEKKTIDMFEAYICDECGTDFGINEHGHLLREGTYALECPVCHSTLFHVYLVVTSDPQKDRPPMHKDMRQQIAEENKENEPDNA